MARGKRWRSRTQKPKPQRLIETLEIRLLYSVHNDSFDVTDLTELRSDPTYSSITGKGIGIAVLDTGVDAANPDLSGKVVAFYNAVEDAIPTSITSSSVSSAVDNDGHGTHVSGIAASADPNIGVAYGASLVDVKVIADSGETQLAGDPLLRGLEFVAEFASQFNIKVVNMSLGESTSSGGVNDNTVPAADDISREIQTLEGQGITVVAAAGNSYANDPTAGESYPAVVSTISVANVWADSGSGYNFDTYSYGTSSDSWAAVETSAAADQFSATSQRSTLANQVVAPGMNIYSDWNGTSTDNSGSDLLHNTISGTSMASPFVAGLVALIQQAAYTYGGRYITDPEEVLAIIKATSDKIPDPNVAGDGRVPISDGSLTGGAEQALPGTGDTYDRVNVYKAIQDVKALFTGTISNADTDNTIATATTVPDLNGTADYTNTGNIGTDGLNQVGANDVDVYKVVLDETGSLTAALSQTAGGTAFIASLRLFDSTGTQIEIATGTSSAGYPTITTATGSPLAAGTYYVAVSSAGNNLYNIVTGTGAVGGVTMGDYTLTLSLSNPDPNGVPEGAVAVDLTSPNYEDPQTSVVSNLYNGVLGSDPPPTGSSARVSVPNGDVDMFKIVAPDTGTLTATVDVSQYGFDGADSYVEVLDANLNPIAENGTASQFPSGSQVQFNVTLGATYYVAVTTDSNAGFNVTNPYSRATGSTATPSYYDLYLTFNNGNTDGTALLAHAESVGSTVTGDIGSSNSLLGADGGFKYVDWYTYTSNASGLLDLTATATSSGFSPSIELWALTTNSSGVTVITNVGGVTGSSQSLLDSVTSGETLYASVTGAGNSGFNWFSLGSGNGGDTGTYSLTSTLLTTASSGSGSLASYNDNSIDYGTPGTLTLGQSVTGNIGMDNGLIQGATDVDLYKFTPTTTGAYDISTDTSQEGSANTYLRLFDSSGNQLESNDNANSATSASLIRADLTAGQTYYIGVSGTGNESYSAVSGSGATAASSTGPYVLSVTAATIPAITVNSPAAVSPQVNGAAVVFTVSLDFASTASVTVDYATADGTAVAGTDYTSTSGSLTFNPGVTSLTVSVPLLIDASATSATTFTLNLSSPTNAVVDGGQGTGTITNLPVTNIDFNAKTKATYTDSNGRKVEWALSGPGSGVVSVIGSTGTAVEVTVDNTTNKSHLSVISSEKTTTLLSSLEIQGSLASLNAPHVELEGDLTVTGTISTLILAGASGSHTLSIDGAGTRGTLELGNVSDLSVMTSEPLNAITATAWTNLSNTDVITAPSISTLKVNGDFAAGLTVGTGAVALETVRIGGAITNGSWAINGSTGSIVAGSTAVAWNANFSGGVKSLQVRGIASGTLTADSIRTLSVGKDLASANITLTDAGTLKSPDLSSLSVGGTFSDSTLRSTGDINAIHVGAISGSTIFAGVASGVTGLVADATDFTTEAEIASFAVTGVRGSTYDVTNSDIAAAVLGKVVVQRVDSSNSGVPFGFSTKALASFIDAEPHTATFRYTPAKSASTLTFAGDFAVKLL